MSKKKYTVGYGKPPKHSQFKPNQTGNKKGRPKGSKNFDKMVQEMLKSPVKVSKDGKQKTIWAFMAILLRLREKAVNGDQRAMERMLELGQTYLVEETVKEDAINSDQDEEIMKILESRFLSGALGPLPKEPPTNDEDDDSWLY